MCIYFKLIGTEHTGPLFPCTFGRLVWVVIESEK